MYGLYVHCTSCTPRAELASGNCAALTPSHCTALHVALAHDTHDTHVQVVATKDHGLVIVHDVTLDGSTNVEAAFPDRKSGLIDTPGEDGDPIKQEGFFVKDFTQGETNTTPVAVVDADIEAGSHELLLLSFVLF